MLRRFSAFLLARRKAYNEATREAVKRPGVSLVPYEEMGPFSRYCHDHAITPRLKIDWGLRQINGATPEVLQLQSLHRQATSEAVKQKIANKIIDLIGIKDSPIVFYLVYVMCLEQDPVKQDQINKQIQGGPVVISIPDDSVTALQVLMDANQAD